MKNGTLEGLGSACSYVEGNYAQDTVDTYYGEAMAVVRAGETDLVKSLSVMKKRHIPVRFRL